MSKREQNKSDKRGQIIKAARELMRIRSSTGFSMRQLADASGVSLATPYNLFGSKQGIISAVMDTDLDDFKDRLLSIDSNPIDRIFNLVSVSSQLFAEQPNYYKTGALALNRETDKTLKSNFGLPRQALMKHLVQQAIQHEYISPRMNADSLSITLSMQFYSWIQLWANDQITLKELETRGHYTFAVTLAGAATEAAREALLDQIIQLQEALPESRGDSVNFKRYERMG